MATQAQIDANRRNAEKSTGAATPEGKACSSRNATRHGLCSTIAIMADEEDLKKDFEILLADLRTEHQPNGPTEDILVYKMAESFFFTNRAQVLLAERLTFNCDQFKEDDSKQVALMLRYHTTADRSFNKNLFDLLKLQKTRQKEEIGFVSQNAQPQPDAQPETPAKPPEKPSEKQVPVVNQPAPPPAAPEFTPDGAFKAAIGVYDAGVALRDQQKKAA